MAAAKNPVAVHFGRNLRAYRIRAEISQEELGMRCSLHRTEIGLLERGARVPRVDTLIKLTSALGVSPNELLSGINWKQRRIEQGGFNFQSPGKAAKT